MMMFHCAVYAHAQSGGTVTRVVPQIAVGSFDNGGTVYEAAFFITNLHSAPITISANFYNPNGSASTVRYDAITQGEGGYVETSFSGTMPSITIPHRGMMFIDLSPRSPLGVINWASFTGNGNFSVATAFLVSDGNRDRLLSAVGVPSSAPDMREFVFPRIYDHEAGGDVGFAIVNTGSTSATITATLRDLKGSVIVSKDLTLGARSHTAIFTRQFFGSSLMESDATTFASLTFSSSAPQFAALALFIQSGILTSLPVERLQ